MWEHNQHEWMDVLVKLDNGSYKFCPASFSVETTMFAPCFKSDQVRFSLLVESIKFF